MTELVLSLLQEAEIPAFSRVSSGDFRKLPAIGPREILVPEHFELDARAVIQPVLEDMAGS